MDPLALSLIINEYRFGLNQYNAKVALKTSNWLEVPIKMNYKIGKNHLVGIGASASFLVSVKNSISSDLVFSNENTKTEDLISKDYEKYKGFYTNSYSVLGSYQYNFKKFGAEIKYNFGLNDIIKNEVIKVDEMNKNNRLSLTLKYSIF